MGKLLKATFILSIIGTLFAGTVTLRQYLAPATEPGIFSCVGFKVLGLSPCPYGLTFFLILAVLSGLMFYQGQKYFAKLLWPLRLVAWGGVIFSGWVGWRELVSPALTFGQTYWQTFALARVPACVWGLVVFLAVAILSLLLKPPASPDTHA
ncbi:MAG: hypothetical protein HY974_00755 [Candidatus Kerfeldbacteria bacterium]|nr:hypothetical protein [Candidatus Kerfeldbacteria bacterium]